MGIYSDIVRKRIDDFETQSGSEIIGNDSDNLSELEREKDNYDAMTHKQRRVADWKSEELTGMNNQEHYEKKKSEFNKDYEEPDTFKITAEGYTSSTGESDPEPQVQTLSDDKSTEDPDYNDIKMSHAKEWSTGSMIIIILPTKSLDELEELWIKWNGMVRKHRKDSDDKSIEIFGMNNQEHYEYIKRKLMNSENPMEMPNQDPDSIIQVKADKIRAAMVEGASSLKISSMLIDITKVEQEVLLDTITCRNVLKEATDKLDNRVIGEYDTIPNQLPFFTSDEILQIGAYNTNNYYNSPDNLVIHDAITTKDWFKHYQALCNGIVTKSIQDYTPMWIQKVTELCIRLEQYKQSNDTRIDSVKQSILELGWNPEVPFTLENRVRAANRVKSIIKEKFIDNTIDVSEFTNNMTDEDIIVEQSKNSDELHPVYIVLTYTASGFGKMIRAYTHGVYSHAAMGLDSDLKRLYSFNAGVGGFSLENIDNYIKANQQAIICIYSIFVKKMDLSKIKTTLDDFILNQDKTHYSFANILGIMLNIPVQLNNSMICSQFVDYVLKRANINLTNKNSALVMPNDFYKIRNSRIYKVYEGLMVEYNHVKVEQLVKSLKNKAKYIKESLLSIVNESQYIDSICANISDINTLKCLDEKSDILNEQSQVIYNKYIKPCLSIALNEVKEFPVQFDQEGNLLIQNMKKLDFEQEYSKSHKLLQLYDETNNIEGMKYELSKLWFLNMVLENKIYKEKHLRAEIQEYHKARAKILNDFKKYLKIVMEKEQDFNFTEYYNNTPFSDATIKINNSTLKHSGKLLKDILKILLPIK